ncbi:MAG: PmoA family protein [Planctomycetaceae bacterium]|nr:PmoA family protein [Planctomycetaceae bacterium]
MRSMIFGLVLGLFGLISFCQADDVQLKRDGDRVDVNIGGELFTSFHFEGTYPKPYFHPVYAPGKTLVVRENVFGKEGEQGNDAKTGMGHFHHKGIWIAIDSINEGLNYWHEKDKIETTSVVAKMQDGRGVIQVENVWNDAKGEPLMKEQTVYTITPDRMIRCDVTFSAIQAVTFGDTKEGLFAIRVHHDMRELSGGHIINSRGEQGEKECWGKPAPWVDYHGQVGGKTVGISLFDSPENFRPSRYHVRGYGLFAINPFGEKKYSNGEKEEAPVTLKPGESLSLKYGLYVHSGDDKEGAVAAQYQKFLSAE